MQNRIEKVEKAVGEHAVKIEGLHREVEHNKLETSRLYDKFDEMVKVLLDIKEQLATASGAAGANKWIIGLSATAVTGTFLLLIEQLLKG